MKKQIFKPMTAISVVALAVVLTGAGCASATPASTDTGLNNLPNKKTEDGSTSSPQEKANKVSEAPVKEFTMTSFYEMENGKPHPQFSLNEIKVKKGDKVRIKVTNTKGSHDINIDEFGVKAETPLDKEVIVEFVADKAGQFVYYCSKPGHRQNGHWGNLIVE